jgi:membrane protein implicated in regulation of membrane protease activity
MLWWQWIIVGAILLGAELFGLDAQFYLVFIGLSAVLVGLGGLVGIDVPVWLQWVAFGTFSLIFLIVFRKQLYGKIHRSVEGIRDSLMGETVNVEEELDAGAETRLDYRGSKWTVRNVGAGTIAGGSRAKVSKVDGLTLHIEAE